MHSGYGIAFDCAVLLMTRNIIIFGVGNSSSSHTDTCKKNVLVLGGGPTDDINDNIGAEEKNFSIKFSKPMTKFCLSLPFSGHNSYWLLNEK